MKILKAFLLVIIAALVVLGGYMTSWVRIGNPESMMVTVSMDCNSGEFNKRSFDLDPGDSRLIWLIIDSGDHFVCTARAGSTITKEQTLIGYHQPSNKFSEFEIKSDLILYPIED
jgi:hypothetical protein